MSCLRFLYIVLYRNMDKGTLESCQQIVLFSSSLMIRWLNNISCANKWKPTEAVGLKGIGFKCLIVLSVSNKRLASIYLYYHPMQLIEYDHFFTTQNKSHIVSTGSDREWWDLFSFTFFSFICSTLFFLSYTYEMLIRKNGDERYTYIYIYVTRWLKWCTW